jgi:glyoxylase-like metal-dependent hydrolase (beta-lactamase superfamily II)
MAIDQMGGQMGDQMGTDLFSDENKSVPICRRDVLRGIAGGVAAAALPSAAFALDVLTDDAVPDLRVLSGAGGNIVVLATRDGQIVVDSGAHAAAADVVATLRTLGVPGGKVAVLLNTHWHKDQTGANEILGATGTTIIAHEKTRQRLSAGWYVPAEDRYEAPLAAPGRPSKAFFETGTTQVGEKRVEFGYLIEAHTDGDLYVRFPDVNIVAVGDAVSPERDPVLDWFGGGWLGGRVDGLAKLLELGNATTRYIPSYGPVVDRAAVQAEHDLLKTIFDRMVVNLRLGQTSDDMLKAGLLDGLPRKFEDPAKFLYDAHKGFWAHHNKLMNDIV